jgi:amino acid adenylation domain-containing protein
MKSFEDQLCSERVSFSETEEWSGSETPFPRERSVLDFFRAQVESQPERVAVKEGGRLMTYGELDSYSNRVAGELRRRGLKLEEAVGVFLPASCDFLAAVIGVLKAGGTYLPVDMEMPIKRIEFLLRDSACRLILSNAGGVERLGSRPELVLDLEKILRVSGEDISVGSDPKRRAYIIYTSGSTGQPKGVEIEHHALTNLVCHYHRHLEIAGRDRASMLSYVGFDASVAEIWVILCAGGTVVIPPRGILLNPDGLIEWLAEEEITLSYVPTGLVEILFERRWPAEMKLRFLITGGDRLRLRPPAGLPFVVMNGYGPTENTVFSTWSVVRPEDGSEAAVPIGRPITNVRAYVLDEEREPVAVNVAGELYLGGEQLARGYLGRPELTAERFMPDPFVGEPAARMYRTGDWVRWLADGELDFLGRKDGQIKIRGWHVELGEIEATLFGHEAVRQVCCVTRLDEGKPSGVVAHIVPKTRGAGLAEVLREYLRPRLPDYMVPSDFVLHESLPLTPQGKVDRAALTALQAAKPASQAKVTGEEGGLEKALGSLWHSLLPGAGDAPKDATFAALGGNSLLVITLMLRVEEIIGERLEVSSFLVNPTFAGLFEAVRARMARTEFQPVLALRKHGSRPPLFFLYGVTADIEVYFDLAEALGEDQPIYGLRSPALEDLSRLPSSMEEAAAEVVGWIRKVQPRGVPLLVGYSWAGLLAFEVARQLEKAEGIECFTALIGPTAPMRRTNLIFRLAHFARYFPFWLWDLITDREHRLGRLADWRRMAGRIKPDLAESRLPVEELVTTPISRHLVGLLEKYQPEVGSEVMLNLFRERDAYRTQAHPLHAWQTSHLQDTGWSRWVRKQPRICWLEGDHGTILKPPFVAGLGQAIRSAMDRYLERSCPPSRKT